MDSFFKPARPFNAVEKARGTPSRASMPPFIERRQQRPVRGRRHLDSSHMFQILRFSSSKVIGAPQVLYGRRRRRALRREVSRRGARRPDAPYPPAPLFLARDEGPGACFRMSMRFRLPPARCRPLPAPFAREAMVGDERFLFSPPPLFPS